MLSNRGSFALLSLQRSRRCVSHIVRSTGDKCTAVRLAVVGKDANYFRNARARVFACARAQLRARRKIVSARRRRRKTPRQRRHTHTQRADVARKPAHIRTHLPSPARLSSRIGLVRQYGGGVAARSPNGPTLRYLLQHNV